MPRNRWRNGLGSFLFLACLLAACCTRGRSPARFSTRRGSPGGTRRRFLHATEDYFHDMDGGIALTPEEIKGRNMWLVWSGGNDRFWNQMTDYTFGAFDLLKIISSHPSLGYSRANRWTYFGLVNEPCFENASRPRQEPARPVARRSRQGLRAGSFRERKQVPGRRRSARAASRWATAPRSRSVRTTARPPASSACACFPNPAFDEKAAKAWDAERYYTDPSYYNRKDLVRPYRVGMSCGFCHVGPSPVKPPADPEHPKFANLSSSVGAQYMWVDRLFIHNSNKPEGRKNYMYQLAHTYRPGTMDTSLVSTDGINNPRTMNAVYDFMSRMGLADRLGHEKLAGGELDNKQFNDFVTERAADRVLLQARRHGAHAARAQGRRGFGGPARRAQSGVPQHRPVQRGMAAALQPGGRRQDRSRRSRSPPRRRIRATGRRPKRARFDTALFFLKAAQPDRLKDAPGGDKYLAPTPPRWSAARSSLPTPAHAAIRARARRRRPRST